ncbi:MAG: HNH endonuclease [Proteobacteria bacterium]|nr:HNH endonuclease [Pseudomonadota bacterium]
MTRPRDLLCVPHDKWWLAWEVEFLRLYYADYLTEAIAAVLGRTQRRVLAKANQLGLRKSPELVSAIARERSSAPGHGSQAYRWQKGHVPVNKGVRRPGWHAGRMREGQFKPGNKPQTTRPIGSLRVVEGQLQRKVNDLPGRSDVRWKPVTQIVWAEAGRELPAGSVVVFKPGRATTDPALITVDALEVVDRAELLRRNSIRNYPPELADVIRLRAQLRRAINKQAKEEADREQDAG